MEIPERPPPCLLLPLQMLFPMPLTWNLFQQLQHAVLYVKLRFVMILPVHNVFVLETLVGFL